MDNERAYNYFLTSLLHTWELGKEWVCVRESQTDKLIGHAQ